MQNRKLWIFFERLTPHFNKDKCIIPEDEIVKITNFIDYKDYLKELDNLGYIDLIYTDKHGKPFVYLALKSKGKEFASKKNNQKKDIISRLVLAFFSAFVTFIFGKLIYIIFS